MVIHPSYYDACDVSCDVIYYVIAVRARRMVLIFFLPYLGNRSKSDPCSYEFFLLRIIHTIISQSIADSSWITLYSPNTPYAFLRSPIRVTIHARSTSFILSWLTFYGRWELWGKDSTVSVVSRYRFDGSRFEAQWGKEDLSSSYPFRHRLRHNQPLLKCVLSVFQGGQSGQGMALTTYPLSVRS